VRVDVLLNIMRVAGFRQHACRVGDRRGGRLPQRVPHFPDGRRTHLRRARELRVVPDAFRIREDVALVEEKSPVVIALSRAPDSFGAAAG
jgi:hypothetical protein